MNEVTTDRPPRTLDWYESFHAHKRSVLLIRHAEREKITVGSDGRNTPLTSEGEFQATEFGRKLPKRRVLCISHTGLARTIRTAECIAAGYRPCGAVHRDPEGLSGTGGSYVHSAEIYRFAHQPGFTRRWLEGAIDPSLIDPVAVAAPKIIRAVLGQNPSRTETGQLPSIHVHVGHDWDIYVLQHFFWTLLPDTNPAEYLDGIILAIEGQTIIARRDKWLARIPFDLNS